MEDSISALMSAVRLLTSLEVESIRRRLEMTNHRIRGSSTMMTRASFQLSESMSKNAPTMVRMEINRSSGPWWASSEISNRSVVTRLMSWPVRDLS